MRDKLKYTIYTGLFATLFIPFIVTYSLAYPDITGKVFTFRILMEILLGLWLILALKYQEFRPKWSWVIGSVAIFTLVMLAADLNAVDPYRAFWGNFIRMDGWINTLHLFTYLLIIVSMFKTEEIWLWFFRAAILAGAFMGIISFSEMIQNGTVRLYGTFGNPIYLAVYFLFIFFIALLLFYKEVEWNNFKEFFKGWKFYFYSLVALLSFYFIYLSSRGVFLGLIIGFFITMLLLSIFEKKNPFIKKASIIGIVLVVLLIGVFISIRQTSFVKNNPILSRYASISLLDTSDQARQLVWPIAIKGFVEKPLLGWGHEGFNYVFNKYYNSKLYAFEQNWFDRVHNTLLDYLIAGGILGLLSYLVIFVFALYLLWISDSKLDIIEKSIITGLIVGYFVQNLFAFDNITNSILFFVILAYIHSITINKTNDFATKTDGDNRCKFITNNWNQNYVLIPVICIFTLAIIYLINRPAYFANVNMNTGINLQKEGKVIASLDSFKKALTYSSFGDAEIREQLFQFALTIIYSNSINQKEKQESLQFIFDEAKKQILATPQNAKYYYFTGDFLNQTGNHLSAFNYLQKARELMPNYQPIRFSLVTSLLVLNMNDQALNEAKEAYELDKNLYSAKFQYLSTAILSHKDNLLIGFITPENLDKLEQVYIIRASQSYKAGDRFDAVGTIEKIIKLDPNFQDQGSKIISNIWQGTIQFEEQTLPIIILK